MVGIVLYKYTLLYPDGSSQVVVRTPMSREELSTCLLGSIHVLDPKYYASKNWDEGARVFIAEKSNSTSVSEINLNFDIPDDGFDISGPAIKEELYHGDKSSN